MGDYTDAEIHAAVNDALLFAFEMLGSADADADNLVSPPDTGSGVAGDDEVNLEDLTITTLSEGSSVEVKKPQLPNTAFGDFVDAFLKYIGVALEIPFELLIMHFSASFSASRAAMELAWKGFQVDQAWLARSVLDPVREWQFTEMVTSGRFDAPGFFDDPIKRAAWLGREWIGPTRIQINPQVESNSDKTDVEMGAKTLEQVMMERTGGSFDTKSRQWLHERSVLGTSAPSGRTAPAAENANDGSDSGKAEESQQ
jgi:capsid protein